MNLQTPIRDRARGLRGPGLTTEQEAQVEEAVAVGATVPNITTTSGEKLSETSALSAVNGGASLISVGGRAVGWTIPAGQTGAGTNVIARIPFSYDEAARLAGSTIEIEEVASVIAGYLAATPFGGNAVRVDRQDGTTDNNAGTALSATQDGTRLVRRFRYTMQGDERFVGGTMQVGTNSPTAATRSLQITSVTWKVVATPATAGATGADAALEARVSALRPAANMLDKVEPIFQLFNGAQALLDEGGRTVGVVIPAASSGQNTILQWRLPMQGQLRQMLPGRQQRLTLGFNTPANWSRAHTLNMQVRNIDLTTTNIVTSSVVDKQISPTRRVMSFTCLIPTGAVLDDLRPFIVLTDATAATADETIELTDFTIDFAQNNSDVMQEAASTTLLGDEFTRSASVDQAVGTIDGTGKRIGALLRSTSFAGIAAALISATNLAAPGAAAAVTVPAGIHVATSLGVIGSGTDGDNIILRGEGMGRSIIDGRLPANTPVATIQATSPVDFNASQEVSDLTIWGKNCRYGWHIDAVKFKPNSRLIARNIEVIHYGNDEANAYWGSTTWASPHGVAIGTCSGSLYRFEGGRKIGPRAAFSAHDQVDFTSPSRIEIINETLTATWDAYWSLRLESIGSMMINQCLVQGSTHSGEISMAVTPWLPTALDQQPADHRCWEIFGSGNSPAVFRIEDFGRALRITSATTGTASKVVISGTAAPILFGKTGTDGVTRIDGDVGMAGYAYGWADIADAGSKAAITKLGARLGNRTGSPLTLTVQVDALAPVNITLDQNYTAMTNAAILAVINTALGSTATASEFAVGQRYRPSITDEEQSLQNTSGTTILMGMALAIDSNGIRTVRPMLSTDLPTAFAGVAWEDIRPGAYGRVKTGGWLPTTDLLRSDGGSPNPGTTFTIDPAKPGYVLSNNVSGSGILPVIRGSLGAGLWTVAVRTQIDGQDVVDQAAELVQEAYDTIGALGDSDNIEAIGRIPNEGAQVIPIDGNGLILSPSAILTGAQAVLPIHFKSSNIYRTKRALIAAHIDGDSLIDDGPRLSAAIFDALKKGRDLIVTEPIWCNTGSVVTAEGTLLKIIGMGEGSIIGGPGVVGPIVKASNIADVGETFARSIDAIVNNIRFDARFVPGGNLTSADCLNLNGFRVTHLDQCDFYAADHFYGSDKGDAGAGIRGSRVVVTRSNFWGFLDAGLYLTANPDGSLDNTSALFMGNNYYGCRGGWAAKRAFEYIRSVGDYFDNCYNAFSTAPASSSNPVTGFTNAARKVSVKGAQIDNPISSAIDLRRAYDSDVDAIISGTIGRYPDGTSPSEVNIVKLLGTSRARVNFIIDNEDASIVASTVAVRIERTVNEDTGLDEGATDNVITGTVRRVNTGLIEGSLCDKNEVTLKLIDVPDQGAASGPLSRYEFSRNGVPYDRARYRRAPRKMFDYYRATANDSGWTGEDSWIAAQIYETDDASGPTGKRVRIGARMTGSSGSTAAGSIEVDDQVILDVRPDQVKCQKALVIPVIAAASVPTPGANSVALFIDGGVLKAKDSTGAVTTV